MENSRLKVLRRKQFIEYNISFIVGLLLFFLLLYVGIALNKFMIFFSVLLFSIVIFKSKYNKYIFRVFPYKEELFLYEKNKLGKEWYSFNRTNNVATIVLGIVSLLQSILAKDTVISIKVLKILIIISPLYLILLNSSLYFHIKKIDNGGNSSFVGYTKKRLILSILAGIVFVIILTAIVKVLIFNGHFI